MDEVIRLFLTGESREKLDPILDASVSIYKNDFDEDAQVDFKGKAKSFVRTYNFLASILPGKKPEPEMDRLSNIIKEFNEQFGSIEWKDADKIRR